MSWKEKFLKENRYLETVNGVLYHGDSLKILAEFPEESVDLILTDPPYGANYGKVEGDESLETYLRFLKISFRILKPDRFLITYCFPKFISEVIRTAEEAGFEYEWIGFNYYPNMFKQKPQPLGYNRHEPFLIFSKGHPTRNSFMKDVIHIIMEKERRALHPHEKPLKALDKLVESASKEGQIVLDPFAGCYDEQTEVLTYDGWKKFTEIGYDDIIACLNPKSWSLEYHKPINIFTREYEGYMYHFKGKHVDLLVTPNHRMVVIDRYTKQLAFKLPQEVLTADQFIVGGVKYKGKSIDKIIIPAAPSVSNNRYSLKNATPLETPIKIWLRFFGMWLAEGCTLKHKRYAVQITNYNKERVEAILKKFGLPYHKYPSTKKDWFIYDKRLWSYLKQFGKAKDKYVPEIIKELSPDLIEIFLDSFVEGDGYKYSNGRRHFYTSSKRLADDIQELLIKCGLGSNISEREKRTSKIDEREIRSEILYVITENRKQLTPKVNRKPEKILYRGVVYCVEVPTKIILVRRNGKPVFCGNSGTTLMSCERLNRKWIGIEIEEEYCRLAKDRIFSCLKQRRLEEFLKCER